MSKSDSAEMRKLMESIYSPVTEENEYYGDQAERFQEIMEEVSGLLDEALELVESTGVQIEVQRATGYWYSHMKGNIEGPGSMFNMIDSARFLAGEQDEDDY